MCRARVDAGDSEPATLRLLAAEFVMPVINRVAEFQREIAEWRQDFHRNPELQYDVQRTAGRVAELLRELRRRRGGDRYRPDRRRRRHQGPQWRRGPRHRAARRHGRAADHRADRRQLCLDRQRQDACLRPRRTHGHAARRRRSHLCRGRAISPARRSSSSSRPKKAAPAADAMLQDGLVERFKIEEFYGLLQHARHAGGSVWRSAKAALWPCD